MNPRFQRPAQYVNPVSALVSFLVTKIFDDEDVAIKKDLDEIVLDNHRLGGTMNGFLFDGELYTSLTPYAMRGVSPILELRAPLYDRFEVYLERVGQLERDKRRIINAFSTVTFKCKTKQEIRDVFPESLVNQVPELRSIERFRDEGYLLEDNPILLKQFKEAVDLLLNYQANRLLY